MTCARTRLLTLPTEGASVSSSSPSKVIECDCFYSFIPTVDLRRALSDGKPLPEFAFAFVQMGLFSGRKS